MREEMKFVRVCLIVIALSMSYGYAQVIYVDTTATGSNNGSSWANAYNSLQDALGASVFNDEIWVAEGIYCPDQGIAQTAGDRMASFELKNGVVLYGGFAAGGDVWQNRDPFTYLTVLSGDLNQDDIEITDPANLLNEATRSENSYHVVKATLCGPIAILDGFIIKDGNANGSAPEDAGGGMYNYTNASPTIENCVFSKNAAQTQGGAMLSEEYLSKPAINNCMFTVNWSSGSGGACCNRLNSMPVYTNCQFNENKAYVNGGAMYCNYGSPSLNGCSFTQNNARDNGGAISITNQSNLSFDNCSFVENTTTRNNGGALYLYGGTHSLTDCTFERNDAADYGGGIYGQCYATLTYCTFFENIADQGGAMYNYRYGRTVTSCTFSANYARGSGGAVYEQTHYPGGGSITSYYYNCLFYSNSANGSSGSGGAIVLNPESYRCYTTFINCTFANNFAHSSGGGIFNDTADDYNRVTIKNSIFWGNSDTGGTSQDETAQIHGGTVITSDYNCIQGLIIGGTLEGTGTIDADPLFVDTIGPDYLEGTGDEDLGIAASSPCIDAGDNDAVPLDEWDIDNDANTIELLPWDLSGGPRFINDPTAPDTGNGTPPIVDMGCYEFSSGPGVCGDRNHPYPIYDFNKDCHVNLSDFMSFAADWLVCTAPECD